MTAVPRKPRLDMGDDPDGDFEELDRIEAMANARKPDLPPPVPGQPQTPTGRKVFAVYGLALLDDVLGIEAEALTAAEQRTRDLSGHLRAMVEHISAMNVLHVGCDANCPVVREARAAIESPEEETK